jgi:RNA polymerase sigma-70 factor, ECF subfamily
VHAVAPMYAETDWAEIVSLYDALLDVEPSPVIALNRAIAVSRANGARAGLRALEPLRDDPTLSRYVLFHATLVELSREAGDAHAAERHYRAALALPSSDPAQRLLRRRLGMVAPKS